MLHKPSLYATASDLGAAAAQLQHALEAIVGGGVSSLTYADNDSEAARAYSTCGGELQSADVCADMPHWA